MPMSTQFREKLFADIPRIAEHFDTPFFLYDEEGITRTHRRMHDAFAANHIDHQQFFAVKALPNPVVLSALEEAGSRYDCSSVTELRLARQAGARPEDIMFTSNNTSQEEFEEAQANGGCYLNLDDISFIDKIPGGIPEFICFRLNPGELKSAESNEIIGDPKYSKFGVPIENIVEAFGLAKQAGAKRFGLHTMVCSNDLNYQHVGHTLEILMAVTLRLQKKLQIKLEFLNMGGGIGIPYRPSSKEFEIELLAKECGRLFRDFRHQADYNLQLFTECGRYITGPHGVLVQPVLHDMQKYKRFVGVPAGMSAMPRVGMYYDPKNPGKSAYHHLTLLDAQGQEKTGELTPADVVGPNCENNDYLARDFPLPPAGTGDTLLIHDAGAHCSAMAFTYNGRTRVQELVRFADGSIKRVCRAETYEDLVQRYVGLFGDEHILGPV